MGSTSATRAVITAVTSPARLVVPPPLNDVFVLALTMFAGSMSAGSLPSSPSRLGTPTEAPVVLLVDESAVPDAAMLSTTRTVTRSLRCRARVSIISEFIQLEGSGACVIACLRAAARYRLNSSS